MLCCRVIMQLYIFIFDYKHLYHIVRYFMLSLLYFALSYSISMLLILLKAVSKLNIVSLKWKNYMLRIDHDITKIYLKGTLQ